MRTIGQLTPIGVTQKGETFEVVYGHRRLKAAQYLRWTTIQAQILDSNSELNEERKLHENAVREAVQPEDEAKYFTHLAESRKWGIREIARAANRSVYYVESRLKVLTWPADIRDALRAEKIGIGVSEALAGINDPGERRRLMTYAISEGCNARTARAWAETWRCTMQSVPNEQIAQEMANNPVRYQEPLYPCFGCERPIVISQLRAMHFCKECSSELDTARSAVGNSRRGDPEPAPTEEITRGG